MDHDDEEGYDGDDEDSVEALVWHWLQLINPGDEESALQQFAECRDELAEDESADPVELVSRVIDWRSGFMVDGDDLRALVQAINELMSRWNLTIDWNGDPDDDEFFDDMDTAALFAIAYDRLAEHGYTLWSRETEDGSSAGWMTQTRDNEPMREIATALHINMRLGSDVG